MADPAKLSATAIRTDLFKTGEDIFLFLKKHLEGTIQEGDILAITSKIVSLAENCLVSTQGLSKREIVEREADHYLGAGGYGCELTIKHGILIPSAGIDESNSESGDYILFPKDPYKSAREIGQFLRSEFSLKNIAVIITDSHTIPLRRGVTGISLAHWGMKGTKNLIGQPDLYSKPLKFTHVDVVDALAVAAVFVMGESNDACPLAILRTQNLEFTSEGSAREIAIEPEQDIYFPLLKDFLK